MLAGSKLTFKFGHFSSSKVSRRRSAVSWPVSSAMVTPFRSERVSLVVKEHVGRVKVDFQVRAFQLVQGQPQEVGSLLAGFERDGNPLQIGAGLPCRKGACWPGQS